MRALVMADRPARASSFVGLLFLAGLLASAPAPVDSRVLHLVDVPRPGWYEADDLAAAAREAGAEPPRMAAGTLADGDTVRIVSGWALPARDLAPVATQVFGGKVSLNRASAAELETLPGVGPKLAARIVAARPFRFVRELDRVKGIGPKKLAALAPRVQP